MTSVIERLRKRQFCPVQVCGATVHVRGLTWSEWQRIEPIRNEGESNGVAIGWCLLNDDQTPVFTQGADEDLEAFGARVLESLDMEVGIGLMLAEKIIRVTQEPENLESLGKKS